MKKYKNSTSLFLANNGPLIMRILVTVLHWYPFVCVVISFIFQTDMICSMSPIDYAREMVSYYQNEYQAVCDLLKDSGLEHADNSTLTPDEIKHKNEMIEARNDSKAALRTHLSELDRLRSENNIAEGSNSQSSGKRTFSEVSDKTNETEKMRRTG